MASISAEPDFALSVERLSDSDHGKGRYHDQLLFNGGHVYWLSGLGDGKSMLSRELMVPGFTVRACDHVGQPDDPAVMFIRARQGGGVIEVAVNFIGATGCIDATGEQTLSVPLVTKVPVVLARTDLRAGLQADGSAVGTLRVGDSELLFTHTVNGVAQQDHPQLSAEDVGRVIGWQALARDPQGVFLCGKTNADRRCALYYFDTAATPSLSKLSPDDYDPVQMGGIAGGLAYTASNGPVITGQLRMLSVHEFTLSSPFSVRTAVNLTPEYRAISLGQSVLFYTQDTVGYSQYRLVDAASGTVRNTDFVTYGSGSSSVLGDHRIGCVVADLLPATPEISGCIAEAWVTPNYTRGVQDRSVYLVNSSGGTTASYAFPAIATVAGFVGYETGVDLLIGVKLADGTTQLWRVPKALDGQRTLLAEGDVVLYGTIRPRGSVL